MIIKFLGTSSEKRLPREDCDCLQCLSKDKYDCRKRSSILIDKKILIDAGPDILEQLTSTQINNLDTVIITHEHDDHTGGLRHLLKLSPNIRLIRAKPGQHFKLFGIDFFAFKILHSKMMQTVGIVVNDVIYIPDSLSLDLAQKYLQDVKVAILDGSMLSRTFGGHLAVNEIIALAKPLKNLKKIYFTHNGHTHKPHKELQKLIRQMGDKRFEIAFDGLEIKV
ncbi:MAG: PhnP protein [Berkelbacteria bacterium GW2011_GWA1_39_10]|uniref:PhnP protein n=1 Tax=Berkelbacteria bacterium GW2011_GWA1_39_10 TaxID=1618332 RepID=A0A0G0LR38_9BACT|nr:MAG: PhnP protein [Berkelbacteria bacterium GW2011_GWA1_39_10]